MNSISIILFGYNESDSIKAVFLSILKIIPKITNEYEIIIIDDGSTDNSKEIIDMITSEYKFVSSIFNKENLGIGKTLLKGYNSAKKENLCCIPLDGQFDPIELLKIKNIKIKSNNFVSFYRVNNTEYTFFRIILSKLNFLLNFFILGISLKDVNWVKIYKRNHLKNIKISLTSSLIETEICSKLIINNIKPIELESKYLKRNYGISKIKSYKILLNVFYEIPLLIINIIGFRIKNLGTRK